MKTPFYKFLILWLLVVPVLFSFESNHISVSKFSKKYTIRTTKTNTANGPVIFIATHLINFDQTKISSTGEPIDIIALQKKKDIALQLLDSIVNTPQFKERVLNGNFSHKNHMSNLQIYNLFMTNRPDIKK